MLAGKLRLLIDVDDFQIRSPLKAAIADAAQVLDGPAGPRGSASHEEAQLVADWLRRGSLIAQAPAAFGRMSRPTSTFSVFERSPMIRLSGDGSRRTSVGIAKIWSPAAS